MLFILYVIVAEAVRRNPLTCRTTDVVVHQAVTKWLQFAHERRVMKKLMTNRMALQFNWKGRGEKRGFSKTNLSSLVAGKNFCHSRFEYNRL